MFRVKLLSVCLLFLLISCKDQGKKEPVTTEQPNIILFLVDDLGWKDLGIYGSSLYQTPHTDALAKEGVKFTNAYAAATVCSPTRASILTGKYPATINCTDWIKGHHKPFAKYQVPDWTMYLKNEEVTLAEALKERGYKTIHIGKWHLGEKEENWPEYHGFDKNIGGWKMGMPKRVKGKGGYFVPYNNPRLSDGPKGEYLTERLAKEAANYIETHKKQPFFMNFWLYNVHLPLKAKEDKIAKYKALVHKDSLQSNAIYAAMVAHMDDALGTVIDQLKASCIYDNTLIIFASDNGGITGTKGDASIQPKFTSNHPLRSGKGDMYEGGVRTPFIISWPTKIKPKEASILSISPDIFPTILGLISQNNPKNADEFSFDGENLSEFLLHDKIPDRDAIYWHYPHYHTEGATPYSAIRKGDWRLIQVYEQEVPELYYLKEDISENRNVIAEYPEKGQELLALLNSWKKNTNAQEPIKNPNYDLKKEDQWVSKY